MIKAYYLETPADANALLSVLRKNLEAASVDIISVIDLGNSLPQADQRRVPLYPAPAEIDLAYGAQRIVLHQFHQAITRLLLSESRAGHFRYFIIFSKLKNDFSHFFSS